MRCIASAVSSMTSPDALNVEQARHLVVADMKP